MRRQGIVDMGVCVVAPMGMGVGMGVVVLVGVGRGGNHSKMLYYNIPPVHAGAELADDHRNGGGTNGNGTETVQRNQTNLASMNGISHETTR
jgi:hypothetical protein